MALNRHKFLSVKKLTIILSGLALLSAAGAAYEMKRIKEIRNFNQAVLKAESPKTDRQSFEAKFATAYWLASNERYKESTLLFTQLLPDADTTGTHYGQYPCRAAINSCFVARLRCRKTFAYICSICRARGFCCRLVWLRNMSLLMN